MRILAAIDFDPKPIASSLEVDDAKAYVVMSRPSGNKGLRAFYIYDAVGSGSPERTPRALGVCQSSTSSPRLACLPVAAGGSVPDPKY